MAAEFAFGTHLAGDPRHFAGEAVELAQHRVDDLGVFQEFAFEGAPIDFKLHALGQGSARDRADDPAGVPNRLHQVVDQVVDGRDLDTPGTTHFLKAHAVAQLALGADDNRYLFDALGNLFLGGDDVVEGVGNSTVNAIPVQGEAHAEIAFANGFQRIQQHHAIKGAFLDQGHDRWVGRRRIKSYGFLRHVDLLSLMQG